MRIKFGGQENFWHSAFADRYLAAADFFDEGWAGAGRDGRAPGAVERSRVEVNEGTGWRRWRFLLVDSRARFLRGGRERTRRRLLAPAMRKVAGDGGGRIAEDADQGGRRVDQPSVELLHGEHADRP